MKMYMDILFGRDIPAPGWYLQAIGRRGARNSAYLVITARQAKRRDPKARPRIVMEAALVDEIPEGGRVFEFYWYPRKKKHKITFEQELARNLKKIHGEKQ